MLPGIQHALNFQERNVLLTGSSLEGGEGQLLMNQAERDRLDALKRAKKKVITQKQAAAEIGITERQVRRLLRKLRRKGDRAVIHELRGRASNRKLAAEVEQRATMRPIGYWRDSCDTTRATGPGARVFALVEPNLDRGAGPGGGRSPAAGQRTDRKSVV